MSAPAELVGDYIESDEDIIFSYEHAPTIKRFTDDHDSFIRALMGPFGSGKSSGSIMELVKLAEAQNPDKDGVRRARFAAIRNTYPQLKDTTLNTVLQWLPDGPNGFSTYKAADHILVVDRLADDLYFEILFRALDRPEHVSNLLSLELTAAWINEAREIPRAVFNAIQGRVGRYPAVKDGGCVRQGVILDTNPPDDDSWFYEVFEEKKPANAKLYRQPGGMDPDAENKAYLPQNYYENLLATMDDPEIEVYVHGNYGFLKSGKPIYSTYNDKIHCEDIEYVPGLPIYRGWDFGLTPACALSQVLPDGRWNTFEEFIADEVYIDDFSDVVALDCAQKYGEDQEYIDIGDPAGQQRFAGITRAQRETDQTTCFAILQAKGIMIQPGEQALELRLGSVRRALRTLVVGGKPQLVVHSRCKKLRRGYQGQYKYRQLQISGAKPRYTDEPDKNEYSHIHDANQYVGGHLFGAALKAAKQKIVENAPLRRRSRVLA